MVNDLNIFAPSGSEILQRTKKELTAAFGMVDIGPLAFHVGLKATRSRIHIQKTLKLSHSGYIEKMLDRHGSLETQTAKIPMQGVPLLPHEKDVSASEKTKYAGKIRSIMYSMVETH